MHFSQKNFSPYYSLGERQVCHIRKNFVIHPFSVIFEFKNRGETGTKALYLALKRRR
jgi:hypothetical protein